MFRIGLIPVISLKDRSWVRIWRKPNRFAKLSQCLYNVLFHSNITKQIKFHTLDKFQRKFFKLGQNALCHRDKTVSKTNSASTEAALNCTDGMFAKPRQCN